MDTCQILSEIFHIFELKCQILLYDDGLWHLKQSGYPDVDFELESDGGSTYYQEYKIARSNNQ